MTGAVLYYWPRHFFWALTAGCARSVARRRFAPALRLLRIVKAARDATTRAFTLAFAATRAAFVLQHLPVAHFVSGVIASCLCAC